MIYGQTLLHCPYLHLARGFRGKKNGFRVLLGLTVGSRISVDGIGNMVKKCMAIDGFVAQRERNAATLGIIYQKAVNSKLGDRWNWILTGSLNWSCTRTGSLETIFTITLALDYMYAT